MPRLPLLATAALGLAAAAAAQRLELPFEQVTADWHGVRQIADGVRGNAARFDGDQGHLDAGPCPIDSERSFTLRCRIRTTKGEFCTPLMARHGDQVGISLVLGRQTGHLAFESWSWQRVKLQSRQRIDDGQWHAIEVAYDAGTNTALLFVDDDLQGFAELGPGTSPDAVLRLGNNIGTHQPFAGDLDELTIQPTCDRTDVLAWAAPVIPLAEKRAALQGLRQRLLPTRTPSLDERAAADWPQRRAAVRAQVLDALGLQPLPERVPLDVTRHGALEQDGIVVERISWRTFGERRATGWLWRPESRPAAPAPAMLCPHGHWQNGARHPIVQARCAAFAKFGWVALAVDSSHAENVAAGASPIGTMTWHNLRALELLQQRDDVDRTRIGVTGCSGGGQQTYYLMAVSDEFAAAAPICMACYLASIVSDEDVHCRCNQLPRLIPRIDVIEMCAVFAPKPVFFGSVTGDWTALFPRQGFPELQAHWQRLGGGAAIRALHRDEGHDYSPPMREAVYGFLHDALTPPAADGKPRTAIAEPPFAAFAVDRLAALGGPPAHDLVDDRSAGAELLARRPRITEPRDLAPDLPWNAPIAAIDWRAHTADGWRSGSVRGDDRVPVPFLLQDRAGDPRTRWTVIASPLGKATLRQQPPGWLRSETRVALVDPRWCGEWQRFAPFWRRNGLWCGRGELYQQAHDLALVCRNLPGDARVVLVGLGTCGPAAIVAATLCDRIERVIADDVGPAYEDHGNRLPEAPELLRAGGLSFFVDRIRDRAILGGDPILDDAALAKALAR